MSGTHAELVAHNHGKERVRVARVWREGNKHTLVEFQVKAIIDSEMAHAFLSSSNAGMTPTDTVKNIVYHVAKQATSPCSAEDFGLALARTLVGWHANISRAVVHVAQKAWTRACVAGAEHDHGFELRPEVATASVTMSKDGSATVVSGLENLSLLKTTQSGYAGYKRDALTALPESSDRIMASTVKASWTYPAASRPGAAPVDYAAVGAAVRAALADTFLGPARGGVFSPSVQNTLYLMAQAALEKAPAVACITLEMPNLHFLPLHMPAIGLPFAHDVYTPTSEPHGQISATVARGHSRL